ncbi:hypothetical protein CHS0354_008200 [Potamilus streckersoni]|uniref:Uncharacterized protein n=1 Tax=Potamilus streckersoni TaxID=2493646 RepID=A0AAE0RWP4_9BIVA|nr:hypothetical protein CHS0354_008200 [Potamilus streckersoni]
MPPYLDTTADESLSTGMPSYLDTIVDESLPTDMPPYLDTTADESLPTDMPPYLDTTSNESLHTDMPPYPDTTAAALINMQDQLNMTNNMGHVEGQLHSLATGMSDMETRMKSSIVTHVSIFPDNGGHVFLAGY